MDLFDHTGAVLSPCGLYRYSLWRRWDEGGDAVLFIGLNPSVADATQDDPTIRRCLGFARKWGFGALYMGNLFAFRATDPRDMRRAEDPVGTGNDLALADMALRSRLVVAAWGCHGTHRGRDRQVRAMFCDLHHLGLTKDGHPRHPLYLPGDVEPQPWQQAAGEAGEGGREEER